MAVTTADWRSYDAVMSIGMTPDHCYRQVSVKGTGLKANQVLGFDGTDYAMHDPQAADGTEVAAAVLMTPVDSATAIQAVIAFRHVKVNSGKLVWKSGISTGEQQTAQTELWTNHFIEIGPAI